VYHVHRRRSATGADIVILHLLLFTMATALLVGLGRVNFPLKEALQSRYTTPALLFWFCVLFLVSSIATNTSPGGGNSRLMTVQFSSLVVMALLIGLNQPTQIKYAEGAAKYLREVEAAISAPVYDNALWGRIYYNPKAMIPTVRYLQTQHLSVFAQERMRWLGDPLSAHYQTLGPERCTGYVDNIEILDDSELPGLRVQGWAWDLQLKKIARSIVFTSQHGRIIGFGYTGSDRPDVPAARSDVGSGETGWKGYISGLTEMTVQAFMITGKGRSACLVGTQEITRFLNVPFEQLGKVLIDVPQTLPRGWAKNGFYPGSGPPPINAPVIGSWVRNDADTGTVQIGPFQSGSNDAIAIPLLTGPATNGLSIRVVDAKSGDTIIGLSPPPVLTKWRAWKILLPRRNLSLEIAAQDLGTGWGEWLALGAPRALK
jgi:hypothetical protein